MLLLFKNPFLLFFPGFFLRLLTVALGVGVDSVVVVVVVVVDEVVVSWSISVVSISSFKVSGVVGFPVVTIVVGDAVDDLTLGDREGWTNSFIFFLIFVSVFLMLCDFDSNSLMMVLRCEITSTGVV